MSWLSNFATEQDEINQLQQQPGARSAPGFFTGTGKAIVNGVETAAVSMMGLTESFVLDAVEGLGELAEDDDVTGQAQARRRDLEQGLPQAVRRLRPDPTETGLAGQVLHPLANYATQMATGAVGGRGLAAIRGAMSPASAGKLGGFGTVLLTEQNTSRLVGESDGLDPETAEAKSWLDGVVAAASVTMPLVRVLPEGANNYLDLLASFGANVGLGVGHRYANSELLSARGYEEMAKQYQALDAQAIAADTVLWAAFRGGAAIANRFLPPQELTDAAMVEKSAQQYEHSPVGIPADTAAANAHTAAMDRVADQLARDEPVDIADLLQGREFVARPAEPDLIAEAVRNAYRPELPAAIRWAPSLRLDALPLDQRRGLRYDAPELNERAAAVEQQYGIPPGLLNAIKNQGERSNSNQVSPAGARGVMQFMPENLRKYGVADATDPVQMIDAAGRYLRDTMRQYGGNIDAVIADYNGGPRQAREVLAGRQPKAKETRDYLARVRRELGRDAEALPPPAIGAADAFPMIPEELARTARAIDDEIQTVETERADLNTLAGGMAELGEVSRMRAELPALLERQRQLQQDGAVREIAKEIQAARPRTSYKQAVAQAETQRTAEAAELEARIGRLEGFLQQNREASQAVQQLALLDDQLATLRDNRAAIEVPAAVLSPVAGAVRSAIENLPAPARADTQPATRPPAGVADAGAPPAGTPALAAIPGQRQAPAPAAAPAGARSDVIAEAGVAGARAADDLAPMSQPVDEVALLREALHESPDAVVFQGLDADGNPINTRLADALADIEHELAIKTNESSAYRAAANCYLLRG